MRSADFIVIDSDDRGFDSFVDRKMLLSSLLHFLVLVDALLSD